jgi:hypothetical protein
MKVDISNIYIQLCQWEDRVLFSRRELRMKYEARALYIPVNDEFSSNSGIYKVITYVKYRDCFHLYDESWRRKTKSTFEFEYDGKVLVHENKSQLCIIGFTDVIFSYILQGKYSTSYIH